VKKGKRWRGGLVREKETKRSSQQIRRKLAYGGVMIQNCNINTGGVYSGRQFGV